MEKDVTIESYMTLNSKSLKKVEKAAKESAEANDYELGELCFEDVKWKCDEVYFDKTDNCLYLNGNLYFNGENIGYFSPKIVLGNDTTLEIIEYRMKKLGKLKTVMEALKD